MTPRDDGGWPEGGLGLVLAGAVGLAVALFVAAVVVCGLAAWDIFTNPAPIGVP